MKKTCILVYLLLVLATYSSLIYHAITLKDTIDFSMFYYVAVHFLQNVSIYAATPWHLFHIPQLINAK